MERLQVDPDSLPHARGGVSKTNLDKLKAAAVFPTLVGVFPVVYPE
jgi:hypothetical protein